MKLEKQVKGIWRAFKDKPTEDGEYVVLWSAGGLTVISLHNGQWLSSGIAGANKILFWLDIDTCYADLLSIHS